MTIASEITRLQNAKASIEASIENKGVTVPDAAKLDEYYQYIDRIVSWWGVIEYVGWLLSLNSDTIVNSPSDWTDDRYGDYDYIDGSYLYLIKPYCYMNYSSSGHSLQEIRFSVIAIPKWGTVMYQNVMTGYSTWWNDYQWEIRYYYFYKDGNTAHFKFWMKELYSDTRNRSVQDITYNTSTNTWSSTVSSWDWTTPFPTWWDYNFFNATLVWNVWTTWGSFYVKWKPN